ncbi:MAG: hypothetical protein ACREQI_09775 [Candidatus Binataceae bacterium]
MRLLIRGGGPAQQFYPNVTPIEYLTGTATMLSGPRGIAVDPPPR